MATVIKAAQRSYTKAEFRKVVRDGLSHPLPDGRSVAMEIERIIEAQEVLPASRSAARQSAQDEYARLIQSGKGK